MNLSGLRCDCGSDDLVAIFPGQQGKKFANLFTVVREIPDRAWCEPCWAARFNVVASGEGGGINL